MSINEQGRFLSLFLEGFEHYQHPLLIFCLSIHNLEINV